MAEPNKEVILGAVEASAGFVQKNAQDGMTEEALKPSARALMIPVIRQAMQRGADGLDILRAIHKGTEKEKNRK